MRDIVAALKDFAHVGENEWRLADLHLGLDSTVNILTSRLRGKVTVEKHYGAVPLIHCIPSQLNQVFPNLLVNACQALAQQGVIAIADSGAGIAPEHVSRIFEPFFTTKPIGSGTGIGLALSYGIVTRHGGRLEVDSQPDVGSTFTVRLPLDVAAAADTPAATKRFRRSVPI